MLLDTGNTADAPTEAGNVRTRALRESMVKFGYKAVGIGDHDLSVGYDEFEKQIAGLDVPFIATNIVKEGTRETVFPPFVIVDAKGRDGKPVRIGVLSVVRLNPVWQKAGPSGVNLAIAEPLAMIKAVLARVRAESDIVVLLASLSKDDVRDLAKQLPDLDLILASYGGIASASEETEGRTRIYYAGNQGKRIGEIRVTLDQARRAGEVVAYMHFLGAQYPEDKAMKEAVAKVAAKTGPAAAELSPK